MSIQPVKISQPRLSQIVKRNHLFKKLDQSLETPVTVVVAPPGAGKSTLINSYIESRKIPCIWYQIDQDDRDIVTLFHYLDLAVKKKSNHEKQTLPLLSQSFRAELKIYARHYFETLYQKLKKPFVLVFDDYHEVNEAAVFHEIIQDALLQLPEGVSAVIITRTELPVVFSKLWATSQLIQFDENLLAFTQHETGAIVKHKLGNKVSQQLIDEVYRMTQGWVAGIVLLTGRIVSENKPLINNNEIDLQSVFDYFSDEIFSEINDELKIVLLKLSYMNELNLAVAKKVTGYENVGILLGDLANKNYFTTRHDKRHDVYQFHPLFKDFLLYQSRVVFNKQQIIDLQRKTALALDLNQQPEQAIIILINAHDWQSLEPIIIRLAPILIRQGRYLTLMKWLNSMPAETQSQNPWLLYWYGSCIQLKDTFRSLEIFEQALKRFEINNDASGAFCCWCGAMESIVFGFGNYERMDDWILKLLQLRKKYRHFPSLELSARITTNMLTALWFRQPENVDLPIWERRVKKLMRMLKVTLKAHHRVLVGINLFYQHLWRGDFRKSKVLIDSIRPDHMLAKTNAVSQLAWYNIFCLYQWLNAEHESCIENVERGLKIAQSSGVHFWDFLLVAHAAHACLNQGDLENAEYYYTCMQEVIDENKQLEMAILYYFNAQLLCYKAEFSAAVVAAETAVYYGMQVGMVFPQACFRLGYAEVLYEVGEIEEAAEQISLSRKLASEIKSKLIFFRLQLLESYMALGQNNTEKAVNILRPTLKMARKQNFLSCLWWRPEVIVKLFYLALEAEIETEYVQRVIRLRKLQPFSYSDIIDNWPYVVRITTLGDFSIEINGSQLALCGKAQKRPLELLKLLISMGDRDTSQEKILQSLWPESSEGSATQALYTTLHRLRKLLNCDAAIGLQDGRLRINRQLVWLDIWALFSVHKNIEKQLNHKSINSGVLEKLYNRTCFLYRGDFLKNETENSWILALRETLHRRLLYSYTRLGKYWEKVGEHVNATSCYQQALEIDYLAEEFYQYLMHNFQQQGRNAEAVATFLRCRKVLSISLGVMPSSQTVTIYKNIPQIDSSVK